MKTEDDCESKGRRRGERRRRGPQGSSDRPSLAITCRAAWALGREDKMREGEIGHCLFFIEIILELGNSTSFPESQGGTDNKFVNIGERESEHLDHIFHISSPLPSSMAHNKTKPP